MVSITISDETFEKWHKVKKMIFGNYFEGPPEPLVRKEKDEWIEKWMKECEYRQRHPKQYTEKDLFLSDLLYEKKSVFKRKRR